MMFPHKCQGFTPWSDILVKKGRFVNRMKVVTVKIPFNSKKRAVGEDEVLSVDPTAVSVDCLCRRRVNVMRRKTGVTKI